MIVYYTHSYSGNKGESHELLMKAISQYLTEEQDPARHAGAPEQLAEAFLKTLTTTGDHGKPAIPGFRPFSISHSRGTWAVLIADEECGLDIQYARKAKELNIARRVFAQEDAAAVSAPDQNYDVTAAPSRNADADDPAEACEISQVFFRIWARREALIKAAGTSVTDTAVPAVSGECLRPVSYCGKDWYLRDIAIPGAKDMSAAVCTLNTVESVRITELHL